MLDYALSNEVDLLLFEYEDTLVCRSAVSTKMSILTNVLINMINARRGSVAGCAVEVYIDIISNSTTFDCTVILIYKIRIAHIVLHDCATHL